MKLFMMCQNCGAEMTVPDNPDLTVLVCPLCHSQNNPPKPRLSPGSFLAGYQIVQNVETFALHETYHAEHVGQKLQVRLQTFVSPNFDTGMSADYYLTAMRKWLKVKQPNIVRVIEAGRNRAGIYFASHLPIDGITLEDRLWRGGGIALKPTLHLAVRLCRVLTWLYNEHGIIYGGLNPRNIILTPAKDIYLAHMTLAPILRERPAGLQLAELATGRPGFMSPEQLAAPDTMNCHSDMFSLGATLYQMLTGKPPYASLNRVQVQMKHQTPSLPDPRNFAPDLPEKVVWLLEVLLAHDPKDRFSNWETLSEVLANIEQGHETWEKKPLKSHSVMIEAPPKVITIRTRRAATKRASVPLYPTPITPPPKRDTTGVIATLVIVVMALIIVLLLVIPRHRPAAEPALPANQVGSTVFTPMPAPGTTPPPQAPLAPATPTPAFSAPAGQPVAGPVTAPAAPSQPPAAAVAPTFWGLYNETRQFAKSNPNDYEGLLDRYSQLMSIVDSNKADLVMRVEQESRAIQLASAGPLDDAHQGIREKVMMFEERRQYDEAIAWLTQYNGPFVKRTRDFRDNLIKSLTDKRRRTK